MNAAVWPAGHGTHPATPVTAEEGGTAGQGERGRLAGREVARMVPFIVSVVVAMLGFVAALFIAVVQC